MSDDLYTSYTSINVPNNNNNNNNTIKEESIYATWPKEKNVWGNNKFNEEFSTIQKPLLPPSRPIPPSIDRITKPNSEFPLFREGIVEQSY